MFARAFAIWWVLLLLAFVNGFVREAWIAPTTGDQWAHAISSLTLSAAIALLAWLSIGWIAPATAVEALRIGGVWIVMTLVFEFGAGHYIFRTPWNALLADYNVFAGRIWILVLITTAFAPLAAASARHAVR
jgi:hypothetical protein